MLCIAHVFRDSRPQVVRAGGPAIIMMRGIHAPLPNVLSAHTQCIAHGRVFPADRRLRETITAAVLFSWD